MLGKTHLAVGTAVVLTIFRPNTIPKLVLGLGVAVVGAVISDIDVGTSESSRDANKVIGMAIATVLTLFCLEYFFHIGLLRRIQKYSGFMQAGIATMLFILVCAYGKSTPHRSFMHSILALGIFSVLIWLILPMVMPYFSVAFLSHLITDLFNFKKVRLLYPLPSGVCFKLFHAKGAANTVLFSVGMVVTVIVLIGCMLQIL